MLLKQDLKRIAYNRLKDSNILLKNKRYSAAIYLAGYAIELTLKFNICHIFRFNRGFPENETEFKEYRAAALSGSSLFLTTIKNLKQIKNHNLTSLLKYSGKEVAILADYPIEWATLNNWGPNQKYSVRIIRKAEAVEFMKICNFIKIRFYAKEKSTCSPFRKWLGCTNRRAENGFCNNFPAI